MKKFLALVMTLAMVFALTACGNTAGVESTESTESGDVIIIVSSEESTTNTPSTTPSTNTPSTTTPTSSQNTPAVCSHKNVQTTAAVAATCTSAGKTESKTCKDCGAVLVASKAIAMTEHDFEPATTQKPKTCKVCGTTEGTALEPDVPSATIQSGETLNTNGATITFAIKKVEYIEDGSYCNIIYSYTIENGSRAMEHSWTLDVTIGDTPNNEAKGLRYTAPKAEANQTITGEFKARAPRADHFGYSLSFS
ncbi:MAG: hypothetical protein IKK77_02485 [Clostridia bacterium]|nr:hypothetical protein [Clostridia bacterium]